MRTEGRKPSAPGMVGRRLIHLDMLRGLAAMGVVLGHARSFVIVDYSAVGGGSLPVQAFYLATSLGHQSVIAFFALSGFVVGGPALRQILEGNWIWSRYFLKRITRLWVVLIPALLLTLGLDTAGEIMGGRAGYEGSFYHLINSGPAPLSPADLSASTLLANLLFLQTIIAPVFGTDGPLWSLANEFWYYVMFPFLMVGLLGGPRRLIRALMGGVGIALAVLLPRELVLLGIIWIAGTIAYYTIHLVFRPKQTVWMLLLPISLLLVAGAIVIDKHWPGVRSDLILGVAFSGMLPTLVLLPKFGRIYDGAANYLSKISYTLYATHFPVLAFIWFLAIAPHKWVVGPSALGTMSLLVVVAVLFSSAMWWLFERNTDRARNLIELTFLVRRPSDGRKPGAL
jgi:peptidoglycan/LPS O-acetylase OafA/YrhL